MFFVVARVHPDKRWFAAADHVPSRSIEMYEVSKRRHLDRAVRIVRKYGNATRRVLAADNPVVAAVHVLQFRHQARRLQLRYERPVRVDDVRRRQNAWRKRIAVPLSGRREQVVGEPVQVQPFGHHEIVPGIGRSATIRFSHLRALRAQSKLDLVDPVSPDAVDAQLRPPQRHGASRPRLRLDARQLEFHRQVA